MVASIVLLITKMYQNPEKVNYYKNEKKMSKNKLELRMYGLVPYNISPIQQGIQHGHAVVEYANKHKDDPEYQDWAKNWKTFIILNGGTTNTNKQRLGTMNRHLTTLKMMGVKVAPFFEPDLGDQLTGIAFILDERIFNKVAYPNYKDWCAENNIVEDTKTNHARWLKTIGGEKNEKIREYISKFRLA